MYAVRASPAQAGRWLRAAGILVTEVPWIFAAPTGANKVTVYWDPVPGATGYRVKWGVQRGVHPNASPALPAGARRFTVEGLVSEQEYFFVVEAVYNGVVGKPSEEDGAIPHVGAIPWDTDNPSLVIPAIRQSIGVFDGDITALSPDGWVHREVDGTFLIERATYEYNPDLNEVVTTDGNWLQPLPQRKKRPTQCTSTGPYRRVKTQSSLRAIAVAGEFYLPPRRHPSANIVYFDLPSTMWNPTTGSDNTRDTPHVYFGIEYQKQGGGMVDVEGMLALHPAGRGEYSPRLRREVGVHGAPAPNFDRWLIILNIPQKNGHQRNYVSVDEPISYGVNGVLAPYGFVVWMMLKLEESRDKLVSFHVHAWRYVLDDHRSDAPRYKRVVVGCAYKREQVPAPSGQEAQVRRVISIAQSKQAVEAFGGWKRTGSFFFKCGVGFALLFAQENLLEMSVRIAPNNWQLWTASISEQPENCPPSNVISVEPPISQWYREVVNIDLRRR